MAIDTPARLAILGAGPIGLEAALYARFLGYDVVIYEQNEIAATVRRSPDERMETPFRSNHSPLGLAAIQAQDEAFRTPDLDALLTYGEWIDGYLVLLAQTDLLSDHLRLHTVAIAVRKEESLGSDDDQPDWKLHVQSRSASGEEQNEAFDGVLDCTGISSPSFHTSEPNYYILGSKSRGPHAEFHFQDGLTQIRELFAILGDRATLDLYAGATRLLR